MEEIEKGLDTMSVSAHNAEQAPLKGSGKPYRILLVAPHGNIPAYWIPLALGYLKSNIPDHHQVKIIDGSLHEIPSNSKRFADEFSAFDPDLVGVTTASLTSREAMNVLKVSKAMKPEVVTIFGGSHATNYPDKVMQNAYIDYLFRGEADLSFAVFLEHLETRNFAGVKGLVYRKDGALIKNDIENETDIDKIRIPDYEALNYEEYIKQGYNYGGFYGKTAPIWVTRGCPFQCTFCSAPLLNGRKIRAHSVEYVVKWIEHLYHTYKVRQFSIIDDNFTFDIPYATEFCRQMLKRIEGGWLKEKIYFATPNGVRMSHLNDELLGLMKKVGWQGLTIAPESGSKNTLKRMKKGLNVDFVPEAANRIRRAGLSVRAFFMVGYPGETMDDVKDTIKLIRRLKVDTFTIGRFVPLPGTPIYDELVKLGEIPDDYIPPQTFALFTPFKKLRQEMYNPPGFENFPLFWVLLREHILLFFRHPYSLVYFLKYYGPINFLKKMFFLGGTKSGEVLGSSYTSEPARSSGG